MRAVWFGNLACTMSTDATTQVTSGASFTELPVYPAPGNTFSVQPLAQSYLPAARAAAAAIIYRYTGINTGYGVATKAVTTADEARAALRTPLHHMQITFAEWLCVYAALAAESGKDIGGFAEVNLDCGALRGTSITHVVNDPKQLLVNPRELIKGKALPSLASVLVFLTDWYGAVAPLYYTLKRGDLEGVITPILANVKLVRVGAQPADSAAATYLARGLKLAHLDFVRYVNLVLCGDDDLMTAPHACAIAILRALPDVKPIKISEATAAAETVAVPPDATISYDLAQTTTIPTTARVRTQVLEQLLVSTHHAVVVYTPNNEWYPALPWQVTDPALQYVAIDATCDTQVRSLPDDVTMADFVDARAKACILYYLTDVRVVNAAFAKAFVARFPTWASLVGGGGGGEVQAEAEAEEEPGAEAGAGAKAEAGAGAGAGAGAPAKEVGREEAQKAVEADAGDTAEAAAATPEAETNEEAQTEREASPLPVSRTPPNSPEGSLSKQPPSKSVRISPDTETIVPSTGTATSTGPHVYPGRHVHPKGSQLLILYFLYETLVSAEVVGALDVLMKYFSTHDVLRDATTKKTFYVARGRPRFEMVRNPAVPIYACCPVSNTDDDEWGRIQRRSESLLRYHMFTALFTFEDLVWLAVAAPPQCRAAFSELWHIRAKHLRDPRFCPDVARGIVSSVVSQTLVGAGKWARGALLEIPIFAEDRNKAGPLLATLDAACEGTCVVTDKAGLTCVGYRDTRRTVTVHSDVLRDGNDLIVVKKSAPHKYAASDVAAWSEPVLRGVTLTTTQAAAAAALGGRTVCAALATLLRHTGQASIPTPAMVAIADQDVDEVAWFLESAAQGKPATAILPDNVNPTSSKATTLKTKTTTTTTSYGGAPVSSDADTAATRQTAPTLAVRP